MEPINRRQMLSALAVAPAVSLLTVPQAVAHEELPLVQGELVNALTMQRCNALMRQPYYEKVSPNEPIEGWGNWEPLRYYPHSAQIGTDA